MPRREPEIEPTHFPTHCFTMTLIGIAFLVIVGSIIWGWLRH